MKNTSKRWLYVLALSLGLVFISTKTIYAEGVESSGEEILQEISEDQEPVNLTDTEPAVTENTGNVISGSDEPAVPAEPSGPAATETIPVPENTVTDEQVIISDAPAASGIEAETPKGTDPEVLPVQESLNKDSVIINEMDTVSEKNDADAEVEPSSVSDNTASSPVETKSTPADDNHTSQNSQSDAPAEPLITDLQEVQESVSDLKSVSPLAIKSAQSFVQASSETSPEKNTEAKNEESLDSDSEKEAVKYYVGYFDEEENVYRTVEEITEPEGLGKIEETQFLFWKYYTLDLASPYLAILHEDGFVLPEGYVLVSRKALGGVDWVGEDENTYDSILKSFRVSDVSEIPDYFVLPEMYWAYIISFEGTDDNPEDIYKTHGVDIELPVVSDQEGEETVWTVSLNYNNDDSSPVVEDRTTNVSISYEFSGWTDGETTYSRGEPFADNRPAILTAVYNEVASADAITLPVIHRDNYAFLGWYLFPSFEEEYKISGSSFVPTYDKQMIYARWEIIGAAYNLWVGGTQVTENNQGDVLNDGKVSYDPESNTLSLAEAGIYGYHTGEAEETNTAYAIYYEGDAPEEGKPLPVFTIHVSGDSYIVNEEQEPGISRLIGIGVHNAALRVEGNDENAALFITTGNADEGSIGILAKDLTLSNIELDTTAGNVSREALGSYGVRADSIKLVGDTAFLASGYDGSFLSEGGLDLAGLSYRPRAWVNYEPAFSMETRWDGETDLSTYKFIFITELVPYDYDLWVNGIRVTSENKDNVLNDESHSVSYVYDADTNTWSLVLNGAVISVADVSAHTGSEEHVYAGIYSKKPLSIVLNGENTITGEPQSDSGSSAIYGIFVDEESGDLDFNQGDDHNGSLRILLKGAENDTLTGIRNKGNTIFRGVNTVIQFDSTGKPASLTGIEDMNSIGMINHSNISITADDAKEFCGLRGGDIDIDDSALSIVVEKADKAYGMHQTTDTGIRLIGKADVKIDVSGANEGYGVYTTHEFLTFDDSVFEAAAPTAAIHSPTINDKNNRGAIVKVNLTDQETIFPGPEYNPLSDQYRYVYLPAYMQYDVWVEGTRVTDKNKEDVLEDGTVSFEYDAARKSGTLILDNASIHLHKLPTVAVGTDASISAGIYSKMDLDIQVNSNSSITNEGSDEEILAGIYIVSDTAAGESYISIKPSDATNTVPVLSISTENSGAETKAKKNLGVYSNKHVFVNGVKVDITSGGAMHPSINPEVDPDCFYYPASAGIYLEDSLTLNEDAEVIARGGNAGHSAGIYLSNGSLFLNYNSSLEGIGGNAVVRSEGVNTTFNGDTHVTGTAVLKAKGGTVSTLETDISESPYSRGLVSHSLTTNENATVYAESSKAQSNGPVRTDESTGILMDLFLSTNDESKVFVNVPESSECGNGIIVYEVDYYSVGIYVNDNSELHVDVDVSDRTYAVNSTLKVTGNAKVDILNRGARVDAVGLAGNLLSSDQSKTDRSLAEESAGNQQMTITVWSKGNPSNVEGISHSIEVMKGLNLTLNIASGTVKTNGICGNIKNNGAAVTLNIGLDNQSNSIICVDGTITESNNGSLTIQTGNASGDIIANLITKNTASRFESGSVLTVNTGDAGKNNVGLWFKKNNGKLYVQDSSLTINLGCAGGETGESVGIKGVSTFDISGSTIHIKTGNAPALSSGIYNDSEKTPLTMSATDSDIQVASGNAAQTVGIRGTVDLDGTAKLNVFSGNGTNSYGIQGNGGSAEGNSIVNVQSGAADEQSIGLKVELPNEYKWIIDNSASLNVTSGSGKQSFGVQGILYIPETSENVLIHTTGGKAVEWSSGVFGMINAAGVCEIHTTGGEAKESFGISSSDTIICDEEYGSGVPKNVVIYATGSDAGKTSIGASGGILISGNTTVYLKSGRADESIGFTGDDNIEVRDDARLFVESGYGKTRSVGVQTSKLAISGNGYVDISAGDSGHESYGAENTGLQMSDSAIMVVKAGNAPDISIGFQGWQNAAGVLNVGTVSGNAALTVNAGDAAESIGVKGNLTIDGGKNGTPVVFINSGISPKGYGLNGKLSVPNNADVHIYGASKAIQHADNEKPDLNGKGAWVGDEYVPWNHDAAALGNYEYIHVFPDQEPYELVSAPGTWEKGSTGTADYHVENKLDDTKTYSEFVSVYIDDQLISAENYTTAPGSIWVKFLPSFMNGLSEGSHKVTAVFRNGYVSKTVQVKQKSSPSPSPAPKGNGSNGNSGSSGIVVTCQMAGYPANYAWNEPAKACQPGFIDANGVFRSTASIRQNIVPNTADQRTYLLTFVLSLISTLICSILLHEKH